jgi:arylsulfatase A-like enzyme
VVGARELTLAEILQRLRYETVGFHASPLLRASSGFGRGFESYVSCEPPAIARLDPLAAARERSRGEPADALVEAAFGRWLEARKDDPRRAEQPFFALVQLSDVGMDYLPPKAYAADFDPEYKGPIDGRDVAGKGLPANAAPRDVEHLRALYDAEVRATDDLIGRLLDALDAADLLDDTIVVVTATHGEELLEHGAKGAGRGVYIESVQVPLVLWSGRGLPEQRRVPDTVGLVDVVPTLLQLALLPPPAMLAFDGRSLLPLLRGEEVPAVPVRSVQADPGAPEQRMLAVREGSRTLLLPGPSGQAMVFDLARDPAERRPALLAPGFDRLPLDRLDAEVRAALALRAAGGGPSAAASP